MRTVYVVTTVPGARRQALLDFVFAVIASIVITIAGLGHLLVQLAGAADAIITAVLGVPRLAVAARRLRAALAETWEA